MHASGLLYAHVFAAFNAQRQIRFRSRRQARGAIPGASAGEYTGRVNGWHSGHIAGAEAGRANGGLLHSLDDLSLRASLTAIVFPLAVVLVWFLAGYGVGEKPATALPRPMFTLAMASFVFVPMFALAGAAAGAIVACAVAWDARPAFGQWLRVFFLLAVGAWALFTAYAWDVVVLPGIT